MDGPDPGLCLVWKAGWMLLSFANFWHEGWQLVLINNVESSRGSCDTKGRMERQWLPIRLQRRSVALRQAPHCGQFYGCTGHMGLTGRPSLFWGMSLPSAMAGQLGNWKWRRGYPDKLPLPLARILALWALVTQYGCGRAFSSAACPVCGSENCCLRPCPALAGGKALEQSSWWLDTADAFQSA